MTDSLAHPVFFVYPRLADWPELLETDRLPCADDVPHRFGRGADIWIPQAYLRLRARGLNVQIARRYVANAINVVHSDDLSAWDFPCRSYIVAVRGDRPPVCMCHLNIVQTPLLLGDPQTHLITHWPQPGLIARDPARGAEVRRVAFQGYAEQLSPKLRSRDFTSALAAMGIEFVVQTRQWEDCREVDVVLAIRDIAPQWLATKPASKLINAWAAGAPAVLGPEPAYRALRQSPLDYLEAADATEALEAVRRLREQPQLFEAMRLNGLRRAQEFSVDRVCDQWIELLRGPAAEGFERWRRRGGRWGVDALRLARCAVRRKIEAKRFWRQAPPAPARAHSNVQAQLTAPAGPQIA